MPGRKGNWTATSPCGKTWGDDSGRHAGPRDASIVRGSGLQSWIPDLGQPPASSRDRHKPKAKRDFADRTHSGKIIAVFSDVVLGAGESQPETRLSRGGAE